MQHSDKLFSVGVSSSLLVRNPIVHAVTTGNVDHVAAVLSDAKLVADHLHAQDAHAR